MPTAPYVLVFLATRWPIQYTVSRWSTSAPIAMSSAPGTNALAGAGAWGSFHDTHHHTAKENAVITRTATKAPVMPDELRKSLTATPKAATTTAQPTTASLGTSPVGITLCTRQI